MKPGCLFRTYVSSCHWQAEAQPKFKLTLTPVFPLVIIPSLQYQGILCLLYRGSLDTFWKEFPLTQSSFKTGVSLLRTEE